MLKVVADLISFRISCITGGIDDSSMKVAFSSRKSKQNRGFPFFFLTIAVS